MQYSVLPRPPLLPGQRVQVEFRFGAGRAKEAYLMPWSRVLGYYGNVPGISIDDFRLCCALNRSGEEHDLPGLDTNQYPLTPPTDGEA